MIDEQWQSVRRVLAVRLDNLGDVLVTTPAIHALRDSLPGASITLLASPVGAQAGELNPDIADVTVYEAPWVDPWRRIPHDSAREQALIARLEKERFDAAVIFASFRQSPLPAAYLAYLAGIPLRLGATTDAAGSLLTTRHKHPELAMHEVERGLDLVAAVGCSADDSRMVLDIPAECLREAELIWKSRGTPGAPRIVVHPGCSMPARTYPWELYAEVVTLLVRQLGATVLVTGGGDEADLVQRVAGSMGIHARESVFASAGELSFPEFCGVIARADLTVTNNTGPMHVSAAVGTPVVALFALTNPPYQWGPWRVPHRILNHDVSCRLCYQRECPFDQECLRAVTPLDAVSAAEDLLRETRPGLLLGLDRAVEPVGVQP